MLHDSAGLPYRGRFGAARPAGLAGLALPPDPMPGRIGARPLKAWRYVGVFCPELMLCVATVRIGPARQSFWAVWDRAGERLYERTRFGTRHVTLIPGRVQITDGPVTVDLILAETAGVETVSPAGAAYGWTRKQGGIAAHGTVAIDDRPQPIAARAIVDDTAAYFPRHTAWRWCAGVGEAAGGQAVAWNLVTGVHDSPHGSERSLWLDGEPSELPPVAIAADLGSISALTGESRLRFYAEATRERNENRVLVRSRYRQPFGTFAGELAPGVELTAGYGVMEDHDVWW